MAVQLRQEKVEAEAAAAALRQQLQEVQEQVAANLRQQLAEAKGVAGRAAEEANALRQQLGAVEERAAGLEAQLAAAAGEREVLQQRAAALEAEVGAGLKAELSLYCGRRPQDAANNEHLWFWVSWEWSTGRCLQHATSDQPSSAAPLPAQLEAVRSAAQAEAASASLALEHQIEETAASQTFATDLEEAANLLASQLAQAERDAAAAADMAAQLEAAKREAAAAAELAAQLEEARKEATTARALAARLVEQQQDAAAQLAAAQHEAGSVQELTARLSEAQADLAAARSAATEIEAAAAAQIEAASREAAEQVEAARRSAAVELEQALRAAAQARAELAAERERAAALEQAASSSSKVRALGWWLVAAVMRLLGWAGLSSGWAGLMMCAHHARGLLVLPSRPSLSWSTALLKHCSDSPLATSRLRRTPRSCSSRWGACRRRRSRPDARSRRSR